MTRAKTYGEARSRAHTNAELNWWIFMRVSGVVLTFLVLGHIYMTFLQVSENEATFDAVVYKLSQPAWKLYDWLLLSLALLHGVNGARYSIEDYVRSRPNRFWVKTTFYTLVTAIFILGSIGLFTLSPEFAGPQ